MNGLEELIDDYVYRNEFIKQLDVNRLFVVGGAIRSIYFDKPINDLDFIYDGTNQELDSALCNYVHDKNKFGGYKLQDKIPVDIWTVRQTWTVQSGYFTPSIDNFLKSAFLNISAIAINVGTNQILDGGFYSSIKQKQLDIVFEPNPYPSACAEKTLRLQAELGFSLSDRLSKYVAVQVK